MQYKAARSTRLLNNHLKDHFGQQRSVVLYGFKVLPGAGSNRIKITGGAVFTHYGQKIVAYDETVVDMPIGASTAGAFTMYAVVMKHNYVADTSVNEPTFEIITMKDWLPKDVSPVKDIREVNPITGAISTNAPTLEHSLINTITEGLNVGGFDDLVYGQDDGIIGYDQIILAKIIVKNGTPIVDSNAFGPNCAVYQYVNPFEQLIDYLGVNIFEPAARDTDGKSLIEKERWNQTIESGYEQNEFAGVTFSAGTVTANHDYLKPGHYNTGSGEDRTPTNSPLYGFNSVSDGIGQHNSGVDRMPDITEGADPQQPDFFNFLSPYSVNGPLTPKSRLPPRAKQKSQDIK